MIVQATGLARNLPWTISPAFCSPVSDKEKNASQRSHQIDPLSHTKILNLVPMSYTFFLRL
jgi:hypothetical protein